MKERGDTTLVFRPILPLLTLSVCDGKHLTYLGREPPN